MQGMLLNVGGKNIVVHGTLLVISGDNLGSQAIGGFVQLATAIRKCRYCMATRTDVNTKVNILHYLNNVYMFMHKCQKLCI